MLCIDNRCTDVYFNLAAEEYLLKKPGNYFMLWQNTPSVVIGKHQNVQVEVNTDFTQMQNINIARRFSGGGAVYHDTGNINLTFIETNTKADFEYYLQQTIDFLGSVGISAYSDERMGIYIDQQKISGSAQCIHKDRIMYHCTLLFTTDLAALNHSLNSKIRTEESSPLARAVASVHSEVTNIREHLEQPLDIRRFIYLLFNYILNSEEENHIYHFSREDTIAIERLREEKYTSQEWIYNKGIPKSTLS